MIAIGGGAMRWFSKRDGSEDGRGAVEGVGASGARPATTPTAALAAPVNHVLGQYTYAFAFDRFRPSGRVRATAGRPYAFAIAVLIAIVAFLAIEPATPAVALVPNQPGGQKVYWTEYGADKIRRADFDGAHLEDVNSGLAGPGGYALDVGSGLQYWADGDDLTIKRGPMEGTTIAGLDPPETLVTSVAAAGLALDTAGQHLYYTVGSQVRVYHISDPDNDTIVTGQGCPLGIAFDEAAQKVYWSDPCLDTIKRADFDGFNVETLVSSGLDGPGGIALDVFAGKMYWVDTSLNNIKKANLDGTSVQIILSSLGGPEDIAVDPVGARIYWTEFSTSKVRAADNDGTDPVDVTPTGAVPYGIDIDIYTPEIGIVDVAIDAAQGKMYYTDWGTLVVDGERWGRIMRANLDGSGREELVGQKQPDMFPIAMALDLPAGKMYWTTRDGEGPLYSDLHRANLDGTMQEDLDPVGHKRPPIIPSIAVDTVNDRLYYADMAHGDILRSDLDGTGEVALVTGQAFPQDIALDVAGNKMYWTGQVNPPILPVVMRSTLTGGSITELVSQTSPTGIMPTVALDIAGGGIYVGQRTPGIMPLPGSILRYNLDGTGEQTIISVLNNPRNIALGPTTGGGAGEGEAAGPTSKIYWTDGDGVHRANLNGTGQQLIVPAQPFASIGGETGLTGVTRPGDRRSPLPGDAPWLLALAIGLGVVAASRWLASRVGRPRA
jgi:DNA-binding beta-propeller fold protein YncE